jgi:hypothetical protein
VTEVRELLESAAAAAPEPDEVPLDAVLAAGRRRVRRRRLTVGGAGVAAAAVVLVAGLPGLPGAPGGGLPGTVDAITSGGGSVTRAGDTTCGDATFDRAKLPGRRVTVDNGDWPTEQAADLLALHGWPRAVPYDAARWTVVVNGDAGVLVASLPGAKPRYLSIHKGPNNSWLAGVPCTPR